MSTRQFVACVFRPGELRKYTYHWDMHLDPLVPGDKVIVASPRDEGNMTITVVETVPAPTFPTKPIIGKAPVEPKA